MSKFETVGYIGVDAGCVMLIDPCYIIPDQDWGAFVEDELFPAEEHGVAAIRGGVVVTTAHGDGQFAVEVRRNDGGGIAEVRVKFE